MERTEKKINASVIIAFILGLVVGYLFTNFVVSRYINPTINLQVYSVKYVKDNAGKLNRTIIAVYGTITAFDHAYDTTSEISGYTLIHQYGLVISSEGSSMILILGVFSPPSFTETSMITENIMLSINDKIIVTGGVVIFQMTQGTFIGMSAFESSVIKLT
jgi:hypothetical protein